MVNKLFLTLLCSIVLMSTALSQGKRQRSSKRSKSKKESPEVVKKITFENGILTSGTFYIKQSWAEETDYERPVHVRVPKGTGPFLVYIALHGRGGTGARKIKSLKWMTDRIVIAPDGYNKGWSEKRPDVDFIRQIIKKVKACKNVDGSNIAIHGFSNGAGLLNRLMIELEEGAFQCGICSCGGFRVERYDGTNFLWDPKGEGNLNTPIVPAKGRRWLQINGTDDQIIPYKGGVSSLGFKILPVQDSFYLWAVQMGEKGPQLPDSAGKPDPNDKNLIIYEYLDGNFKHVKAVGYKHGVRGKEVQTIIKDFISQPPMSN